MFTNDRNTLRQMYFDAYQKLQSGEVMTPLEDQIAQVVLMHPEYQAFLRDENTQIDQEFPIELGQNNPFLHMGLHMALLEQTSTNRPAGIAALYKKQLKKTGDAHLADHCFIEHLAEAIWSAQRNGTPPDEQAYFEKLKSCLS